MAYSTPLTAVSNATLTAAQWNASVRDNFLETAVAKATVAGSTFIGGGANSLVQRIPTTDRVNNSETTTATGYGALPAGTPGPAITVATGTSCIVVVSTRLSNNTATAQSWAGFAISGATTLAAQDDTAVMLTAAIANDAARYSSASFMTGLAAGTNTFTMQYKVSAGTGTFSNRQIWAFPL